MRVTVDTNFLVSATQWSYSVSHKLLLELIRNNVDIYTTEEILEEFSKVLRRDFGIGNKKINSIINEIRKFANLVEPKEKVQVVKDDPDDDKVIECAIESSSKYILTYDKHLLKIKECFGIKIVKPEELLLF